MSDPGIHGREVAGRFSQTLRNETFDVIKKLFPEKADETTDLVERIVEEEGLQETIAVICAWFRSDTDAEWLDHFSQSSEGRRFIELYAELSMRSMLRRLYPHVRVPPPDQA
jgi:hypothetical protein